LQQARICVDIVVDALTQASAAVEGATMADEWVQN
jgi:hypothetical protein